MGSLRLDLNQFKSSGIYTIEIDQSENLIINTSTIRLVVGFSKKGPFNTPVFCPDIKTARNIFGDVDTLLERKGSFFHRSLFTCLQNGPVFALNLLAVVDDDTTSPDLSDKVNYRAFSVDTVEVNGDLTAKLLSSFYNKERFWTPDSEYFHATLSPADEGKLLSFVNIGKSPISVIVKKSDIKGYDLTADEWYNGSGLIKPEFLNDDDFISDFFLDVITVQGDWTDYATLSVDPVYSAYFTPLGFNKTKIKQFMSLPEVAVLSNITGCVIPDFTDKNGVIQFLETLVNNATGTTGLFCTIDKAAFDDIANNGSKIDLVGHNLIATVGSQTDIDFISYKAPLINDYSYANVSPSYRVLGSPWYSLIAYEGSAIYDAWVAGTITDGDYIIKTSLGVKQYLKFFSGVDNLSVPYVDVRAYDSIYFTTQEDVVAFGTSYNTALVLVATNLNIVSLYGNYNEYFSTITPNPALAALGNNEVLVSVADAASTSMSVGDLLVDATGLRLTRIIKMSTYEALVSVKVTCSAAVKIYSSNRIQRFERIQDFVQEWQFTYLKGFTLRESHLPNGSDLRMNTILDVMFNTNIAAALANKDIITFRYIVDTFNGGIEPNSKYRLATIAKSRQKCLALLNAPSAKQFLDNTSPQFTDAATAANPKPLLNTSYIKDGGNLSLNPEFTYSLVDENSGSKYVGYFFPNLVLREAGRNISIPPAAHVSNLFIQKFLNGTPFAIVAGARRGRIEDPNLVGLEYDLVDTDRDNLEPFGINPIIRKKGVGTMIYANQTGFQRVNSALNNLHVRDLLITIEDDIEQILNGYVFEFNDASTRLEIKAKTDNYMEGVLSAGGVYDFLVIMDSTNNTNDIIDQNIGILDVIVEPARGIQKMINRITIVKTGGVASGGFTLA